tara:strand:- start:230 stop:475 length:246 start_codon:yes stop_codon:yes gene_type:complete
MNMALPILLLTLYLTGCCCFTCEEAIYLSPSGKAFPAYWGKPPEIQTKDYVPLPNGFGHGSSTLLYWIQVKQRCGTPLSRK